MASFIDYFLRQELWKNIDGFRRSMHLHRDADGKLHMAPSWDFDLGAAGLWFYGGTDPRDGDSWEGEVWRSEKFLLDRAAWMDAHIESVGRFAAGELTY